MAAKPIDMLQIRCVIQSFKNGTSIKTTVARCHVARNTVRTYRSLMERSGLSYEALLALNDEQLNAILFDPQRKDPEDTRLKQLCDQFPNLKTELARVGVTKQLLWQEYKLNQPDGFGYSQFCYHFGQYLQSQDMAMHFEYEPGEKMMIDFAGKKFSAKNSNGAVTQYQVFMATLPFSGFTYTEAVKSQKQGDFLRAIENALMFFGGVPKCIILDNLKSGVDKPDRYEPKLAELMERFCLHYNTSMMPARPREPRDKPHVEKAVHLAYERIYAPLRNRTFNSLEEINDAIFDQMDVHHSRRFRNSEQTRSDLFITHEKELLGSLPSTRVEIVQIVQAKVQKNYHVLLGQDMHFYSVPFEYVGKQVEIHYTHRTVEVYLQHSRIAIHPRMSKRNGYCTLKEHMPESHLSYHQQKGWTAEYFCQWAAKISPIVEEAIKKVLELNHFYQQNYNACLGILRLAGKYSPERLTIACEMALRAKAVRYRFISNVLQNNTDKLFAESKKNSPEISLPVHENLRGPEAYQ